MYTGVIRPLLHSTGVLPCVKAVLMIFSKICAMAGPPAFSVSAAMLSNPVALLFFRALIAALTSSMVKGVVWFSVGGSGILRSVLVSLGTLYSDGC